MAAAVMNRLPSLTEGELLAARLHRRLRPHSASAPKAPASEPCAPLASKACALTGRNKEGERMGRIDKYKRIKLIGEGAFGAVCKARDRRTGKLVAIKSMRDGGRETAAALLREAALLAACAGNPTVVSLREVARESETDGFRFHLVMDYVGVSLCDIISARRRQSLPFDESETRRAMAQLLAGVRLMHAQGIVHCDLKPGNVLVGEEDRHLKICDFGLSKSAAALPLNAQPEGTVGYMAPEVLLCDKNCGMAIDIWALGCIMAELLTGQKLFPEENLCAQLIDIVSLLGIPDAISLMPLGIDISARSQLRDRVPEEKLSAAGFDVLRGLLEYDPRNRHTAAAALQMAWFEATDV